MGAEGNALTKSTRVKVQLSISIRDLVNVDLVGKTDSLVEIYQMQTSHQINISTFAGHDNTTLFHGAGKKKKWVK